MYEFTNENWDKINRVKCEFKKILKKFFLDDV